MEEIVNIQAIQDLEEAEINNEFKRKFHDYDNAFQELSDKKFVQIFRLKKNMVEDVIDLLQEYIVLPSRVSGLDISRKILTALRFFASGSYQMDIGQNINMAISQPSVSRCIQEVTDALNRPEIFNAFVKFPSTVEELQRIRNEFYAKYRFPGVIGCVDCTHVAIYPPKITDNLYPENVYVNRKGYHSINVQLVCDSNLTITNVCARYPGSTNDSYIWNNSNVSEVVQNLYVNGQRNFYLLGDSGYALRPWLLTPINNALPNTPEEAYNQVQMSTRSVIERCNGVLKLRFRCLLKHRVLHYKPERASKIINACTVLHNMCINNNLPPVDAEAGEVIDFGMYNQNDLHGAPIQAINPDLIAGRRVRDQVIRNHFIL